METNRERKEYRLGIDQVRRWLPHRSPFLMVDRILEIHPIGDIEKPDFSQSMAGIKVVGLKAVTYNEPIFQGHFPDFSIFPGVMVIEAMAQVGSFSVYPYFMKTPDQDPPKLETILVGVDNVRFRRPVVPGDSLRIETLVTKTRRQMWIYDAVATVDGEKVAEASIMANLKLEA
jgi:3-hydroxyacyl-[acyl-carrier-protein] dehydratase